MYSKKHPLLLLFRPGGPGCGWRRIIGSTETAPSHQEAKKTGTPHNIGAILFFLPGYGITLKNIEEATKAARERALHLNKLKEKKGC